MKAKQKAKEIVNSFYQPLGMLNQFQKLNSKQMWKYAQDCAKAQVALVLDYPDVNTEKDVEYWKEVLKEIDNI